ncbi:hypothetical protein, partial [Eudoraea sp.]|uniref:hypothetical protein n=1 Tax=Eudoraea sp. TaxID=1979955 RepID=UPI003C777E3B
TTIIKPLLLAAITIPPLEQSLYLVFSPNRKKRLRTSETSFKVHEFQFNKITSYELKLYEAK